ncbi:MAG: hypothetical protein MZV65_36275 [Chromatiales bacterium]|nr:hypothetical protein [Chromatiales bacterium]
MLTLLGQSCESATIWLIPPFDHSHDLQPLQVGEHFLNGMTGSEDDGSDFAGGVRQYGAVEGSQSVESGPGGGVKKADVGLVQVVGEEELVDKAVDEAFPLPSPASGRGAGE